MSDSELPIGFDKSFQPKEVIFAELNQGYYFGELSLCKTLKQFNHLRDVREGRCYTSMWAVQNTHFLYLENKDYENFLYQQEKRKLSEMQTYFRKVPIFTKLTYR